MIGEERAHLLVVGVSARAAAASAARAGFRVTAVDAFADLDQHPAVRAIALPRQLGTPFTAKAAARVAQSVAADAVAYLSPFENDRRAVALLARDRALWGNPPDVLRRVRDPVLLANAVRARGFAVPGLHVTGTAAVPSANEWLLKPRASGGGHGIRAWRPGGRVPDGWYLQERIDGVPASIVFVAASGRVLPLGISRQIVGDAGFGAHGYRYCGSILPGPHDAWRLDSPVGVRAVAIAEAVTAAFGLVGVNGIDVIVREGVPVPIEVNPRWCASVELVERAHAIPVFAAHARACTSGDLPHRPEGGPDGACGKAVVFARRDAVVGDTRNWCDDDTVHDVPVPGTRVEAGQPVCTVFAAAGDVQACHAALVARAERVYAGMARWAR